MIMNNKTNVRKLPVGLQSFEKIRRNGCVYVDKTDMVWQIANERQNNFLSRPRRFGKSLLTSTLKCYFEGKQELFEGLKIMSLEKEWKPRQVFHFDFSGCNTADELNSYLNSALGRYEEEYPRDENDNTLKDRFFSLMIKGTKKFGLPVAVLVDEYDSPLQHTLYDADEHEKVRNVYASFFPALKTGEEYIQCTFLTGITKFTQLSIFSTLNNVSILGSWPQYATVCGITEDEIRSNFQPELEEMAKINGWNIEETLAKLKEMYDGYHFSKDLSREVYNPYSLINALAEKDIANFWVSSGGSTMLNDMLIRTEVNGDNIDNCIIDKDTLERTDVSLDNVPLFLYQAGYLTIKDYSGDDYTLGFPNKEVRTAFYKTVLPNAVAKREWEFDSNVISIRRALKQGNVEEAMQNLKQLVSETPYAQKGERNIEERFRFIVKNTLFLCGCRVEEEKQIATGRVDLVAYFRNMVLVIELKLDENGGIEAAKKQLADRDYAAAFKSDDKQVYEIAVSFNVAKRGISDYYVAKV